MVDLHPNGPGLDEGHPWLELGRGGIAWRVTLGSLLVGMLGVLLFGLLDLGEVGGLHLFSVPFVLAFGMLPAPVFGLLAACVGPWLRRFIPFTQGFLFGLFGVCCIGIVLLCMSFAQAALLGWCTPSNDCPASDPLLIPLLVLMLAGLPLIIMAGAGLGIAILISRSRSARIAFAACFIGTAALLSLLLSRG